MKVSGGKPGVFVDLTEYGEESVKKEVFSYLKEKELEAVRDLLMPLVTINLDWGGQNLKFKAGSNVGVMETHGIRVQVRPKISAKEFITLIRYSLSGKIPPDYYRSFSDLTWEVGFEDALCTLLNDEAKEILKMGLSRKYEEKREPLTVLRGRPIWEQNFPWRGSKTQEITCRYHRLTYDDLDNQLMLWGLRSGAAIAKSPEVRNTTFQYLKRFGEIASEKPIELSHFDQAAERYTRLTEHYQAGHELSRLLIYGLRPESFFEKGRRLVTGIALDMADLFEKFIARLMNDILSPVGLAIKAQSPDRHALLDAERQPYAFVRPDLEIWSYKGICGVMDAKYKPYWETTDGFRPRKISNEDLYQLFFYQQRIQRKHNLPNPPMAAIVAPLPEEDERQGRPCISERFKRVIWQAGQERAGDVRLILIPMTGILRLLAQRGNPIEAFSQIGLGQIPKLFLFEQ